MKELLKSEIVKSDFKRYFDRLGGLHDAIIKNLVINFESNTLEVIISDPLINFNGSKEYAYIENLKYTFYFKMLNVTEIEYDNDGASIYDIVIQDEMIEILVSPCGKVNIYVKYFICTILD